MIPGKSAGSYCDIPLRHAPECRNSASLSPPDQSPGEPITEGSNMPDSRHPGAPARPLSRQERIDQMELGRLPKWKVWTGDAVETMRENLADGSVDCIVTSPPYYFKRDYGVDAQIGLESTPGQYIDKLLAVFDECYRVLSHDGTLWINLGDGYSNRNFVRPSSHQSMHDAYRPTWKEMRAAGRARMSYENVIDGVAVPEKSLMMLPERLAIAMTERGWILRNRITWHKSFSLPDATSDRVPVQTEPILFFAKSKRYVFNSGELVDSGDVWRFPPSAGTKGHTATFNPELARRCLALGNTIGGVVLDPFSGSGTTGVAALNLGMDYYGIDINEEYTQVAEKRLRQVDKRAI